MSIYRSAANIALCALITVLATFVAAQPATQPAAQPASAAPAQPAGDPPAFSQEELDQMLAPLALYSDDLLAQVLMASTYPLEVVAADRWVKANKSLTGEALADAVHKQTWDESVKSLCNVPDVLAMMSEKLEWTQKLGDAVIAQQQDVMAAIQRLRGKAKDAGKLESNDQQKVEVQQTGSSQTIVIEQSDPDVIYVPSYDSTVVYGAWPYPSYPPYPYYPPGYVASGVLAFGAGVACGAIWANAWGNCNWGGGDIDIDIDKNVNRDSNRTRNSERAANRQSNRQSGERGAGNRTGAGNRAGGQSGKFQHNPSHRGSVPYRDSATAQRNGGTSSRQAAQSRQDFRGRTGGSGASTRPSTGAGASRAGGGTRPSTGASRSNSALSGAGSGGRAATQQSARGNASRSSASASRSSPSRSSASRSSGSRSSGASRSSGGSRSGGGGSRGGGGGGRGGGGGGGRR